MYIKNKSFVQGDQVLLYDSKYQKDLGKLQMHWIGTFTVAKICESGAFRIMQLGDIIHPIWVNGTCLKPHIFS